ncbi:hypothetical protein PMKS-001010 [Pichia membranifaciens]|uniref:Uncharacterized protein n=1 Tax=Pichia membranifaciens TaxID=4926 RepID=A0A1Q2YDD8_9ASCO|nr:hypothetical protein PMKS-001010 [Pichia membranifaciens]
MKKLSTQKFIESARQLNSYISTHDITGNSDWIIIYLLVAYLKLRFIHEGQRTETLSMITIIEAMKIWLTNKRKRSAGDERGSVPKITELDIEPIYDEVDGKSTKIPDLGLPEGIDIESDTATAFSRLAKRFKLITSHCAPSSTVVPNQALVPVDPSSVETEMYLAFNEGNDKDMGNKVLLPYERTMIESFVFNYSSLMFSCDKSLIPQMTSPFAKVCWLGHFYPLSEEHKKMVSKIRSIVNFYTRPILPIDVHTNEPENVQKKLLESCYAADFVSKAVFIYSTKLLYPDMEYEDDVIQTAVEQAYEDLLNISIQSQIHMILGFAFTVIGSVAVQKKHREYLVWKLKRLATVFCVSTFGTIIHFYEIAWSKRADGTRERGWDTLDDAEAIKNLVI